MHNLIRLPQRFAKTSVGWLLRQISKFDKNYVLEFLENNRSYLTKEVINNALKYSDKTEREQYYD
jgi:3-methyladenine DNA glycosylase AlkD